MTRGVPSGLTKVPSPIILPSFQRSQYTDFSRILLTSEIEYVGSTVTCHRPEESCRTLGYATCLASGVWPPRQDQWPPTPPTPGIWPDRRLSRSKPPWARGIPFPRSEGSETLENQDRPTDHRHPGQDRHGCHHDARTRNAGQVPLLPLFQAPERLDAPEPWVRSCLDGRRPGLCIEPPAPLS